MAIVKAKEVRAMTDDKLQKQLADLKNELLKERAITSTGGAPENPIADHLRKFWDPRMRREIIAHVERGGAGLDPAALKAVRLLARV